MESFNAIHNNVLQVFSEQQYLDCVPPPPASGSYGCEGGVPADVFEYASIYGVKTEKEYPYIGVQGACNTTNSTSTTFRPKTFDSLSEGDNDGFIVTLNLVPISVAIDATNLADYVSGVFSNCNSTLNGVNHAVLAVGYDKQGNWILKNSWADDWGQQGYFLLAPNNTCGILDMAFYVASLNNNLYAMKNQKQSQFSFEDIKINIYNNCLQFLIFLFFQINYKQLILKHIFIDLKQFVGLLHLYKFSLVQHFAILKNT
ncbi:hypothetical protein ABPG72_020919 [Tetrahymena utriculariae]